MSGGVAGQGYGPKGETLVVILARLATQKEPTDRVYIDFPARDLTSRVRRGEVVVIVSFYRDETARVLRYTGVDPE